MPKNKTINVDVVEEPVKKPVKKVEKQTMTGVVVDCDNLNVRDGASVEAIAICQIKQGDTVEIDSAESTKEWLKIKTVEGIKGFCMKKYIEVK